MDYREECYECGSKSRPKVVKGIEICRECGVEWMPYEPFDDE